jgi:hypothetical protein
MPEWLSIIEAAQKHLNNGQSERAQTLCRNGIKKFGKDHNAFQWLMFNLMLSEVAHSGFVAAQAFVRPLVDTGLNWNAKLYTLEMALAGAKPGDKNLNQLYKDALYTVETYVSIVPAPDDINIISSMSITEHMFRLFQAETVDPLFHAGHDEDSFPLLISKPARSSTLTPPSMCNRLPHALAFAQAHGQPLERPLGIREIGPGYILRFGQNTVLFDINRKPLPVPYGALPRYLEVLLAKKADALICEAHISGTSLFIGDYFSQTLNFCHWTLDGIARIIAAKNLGVAFDQVVGVFEKTTDFQEESLQKVLSSGQLYIAVGADDGLVEFENLIFADNSGFRHVNHPAYNCDSDLLPNLRHQLMPQTPLSNIKRRLYVPRRHNRVVINEQILVEKLQAYGFEILVTDLMTWPDQIKAFSEAEAVVAPHGAALTNLLFAPAGCKVLELFPPFGGSTSFYWLSNSLDLDYGCYIDDVSQGPLRDASFGIINNTAGIEIDLEYIATWLNEKFKQPQAETISELLK